jgi:mono/diheme cytochrome c family protein
MSSRSRRHRRPPSVRWAGWLCAIGLIAVGVIILAPDASAAQAPGDADAGREIYVANCAMCHGADATGMMGMHPALRGAVGRLTTEGVEVTIRNGRQTTPPMPAFGDRLSDEQIADVIAYLDTLPPGPRNFGPEMTEPGGMMPDNGMMDRMMDGGWDSGDVLLAVVLIVLVAVLILVAVLMVNQRRRQAPGNGRHARESSRDILDRRYAAGELSREQYQQAREDLDH